MNKSQRVIIVAVGIVFILAVLLTSTVNLITDWFWFNEIGYQQLFTTP